MCFHKSFCLGLFFSVLVLGIGCHAVAQEKPINTLSLDSALRLADENNAEIVKHGIEKEITHEEVKEKKELRLPDIGFNASYARVSSITEFTHGNFGQKKETHLIPEMYGTVLSASLPVYSGNAINNEISKGKIQDNIAQLRLDKVQKNIHLQVVAVFLGVYRLTEIEKLITENIAEEKERLKEVKVLLKNGVVTKNEVLRAELQLTDREQALLINKKDMDIALHELKILLELPEEEEVSLDLSGLLDVTDNGRDYTALAKTGNEDIKIAHEESQIAQLDIKIAKAGYYPQIRLFGNYAYKYPNYMFFPPDPYPYTFGQVGVEAVFDISRLYKNKTKVAVAKKRAEAARAETRIQENTVQENVFRMHTQYREILDKFPVTDKAEALALENYRLVKLRYFNQLVLITEMIDADNALLQAKFNKVTARIDAVMKYYETLHAAGIAIH